MSNDSFTPDDAVAGPEGGFPGAAAAGAGDAPDPAAAPASQGRWPLSRAQAFCLHLTLSLLVFSALVFAMLRHWFPGGLFALDGGWEGLKLVAMVDLVLGPALTLLLYRPGKPKLALDMGLIAAFQIAALGYGFAATYQQRTVAIVFADGRFNTVSAQAHATAVAELEGLGAQPRPLDGLASGPGVPLLFNPAPGPGEFGDYLAELLNGWPEPHERSDRYVALAPAHRTGRTGRTRHHAGRATGTASPAGAADVGPEIAAALPGTDASRAAEALADAALSLEDLDDPAVRDAVERALDEAGLAPELVQLHRFRARYADGIAVYDPRTARILDWVSVAPETTAAWDGPGLLAS